MLYHADRTIYEIDADYSNENWHEIDWDTARDLIWRRLDRDYRNEFMLQEKIDFIYNRPNEIVVMSGNLFQWIP